MSNIKKIGIMVPLFLLLSACGGTDSQDPVSQDNIVNETTSETETSTEIETTTGTTSDAETTCIDTSMLNIIASDDNQFDAAFEPSNAIDNDTAENSRWSNLGISKELTLDFGDSIALGNVAILWYKASERTSNFEIETSNDNAIWTSVLSPQTSTLNDDKFELYELTPSTARYLKLIGSGNSDNQWNSIIELVTNHCGDINELNDEVAVDITDIYEGTGVSPPIKPALDDNSIPHSIELIDWYLNTPEADLTDEDLDSLRINETTLAAGYEDDDYFYPSTDGGLIFRATVAGAKTSVNTKFTRTELREMLRRGDGNIATQGINDNNWVFSSATSTQQNAAGGIDGKLSATLAVNYVTTTGDDSQVGRVIIGQIHANDDEPIRLYYRKLPNNTNGSIYFAHEPQGQDDEYVEMIGTRSQSASNPADGIALNEKFSYSIEVIGTQLEVTIIRDGKSNITDSYDMSNSDYYPSAYLLDDNGDFVLDNNGDKIRDEEQYMYFKVGVYNQNNTGLDIDYVQATFYEITNTHTNYNP